MFEEIKKELDKLANKDKAKILSGFFKTAKGDYGEGDIFLGINVPVLRYVSKKFKEAELGHISNLLDSPIHEHRMIGLFILIELYHASDDKKEIVEFYLSKTKRINNWDLVDLSADKILGNYLLDKDRTILYKLVKSDNLWERRIAIISTFAFIKNKDFKDTLKISEILLKDKHDLIQKAVGWMLREIGKRNQEVEEQFLIKHFKNMPRTMLRYSIEKFDKNKKEFYMKKWTKIFINKSTLVSIDDILNKRLR